MPRTLILALLMLLGGASCSSLQGMTGTESELQTVGRHSSVEQVLLRRGARQEDRLLKGSKKAKGSKGPKKSKAPKGKGKGSRRDLRVVSEEHREEQIRRSLIESKADERLLKGSKKAKGSKGPKKSKAPKGKGKGSRRQQ